MVRTHNPFCTHNVLGGGTNHIITDTSIQTHAAADFWIMGTCEPYVDAWAGGPIRLYAPAQGCDIQEEVRSVFDRASIFLGVAEPAEAWHCRIRLATTYLFIHHTFL